MAKAMREVFPLKPPAAPILAWTRMPVKLWFTMNHGGWAVPHALSKTGLEELIVQHISIIKFLAPVLLIYTEY
ncbi:hypothetical protein [Ruminiclostridium cellobioparum]|uniref:hypothetical protein n=1 Tax=Ruminiclostridium cellobioparum TaxID=29355 RepID=UPI0028AFBF52|nr:hypothetical protein [Ruminiclostridium cellobioparum]